MENLISVLWAIREGERCSRTFVSLATASSHTCLVRGCSGRGGHISTRVEEPPWEARPWDLTPALKNYTKPKPNTLEIWKTEKSSKNKTVPYSHSMKNFTIDLIFFLEPQQRFGDQSLNGGRGGKNGKVSKINYRERKNILLYDKTLSMSQSKRQAEILALNDELFIQLILGLPA